MPTTSPAGRRQIGKEALGPRDAGDGEHARSRVGSTTESPAARPCDGSAERARHANAGRHAERAADALGGRRRRRPCTSARVGARRRGDRLAQPPAGSTRSVRSSSLDHEQIDVARQREVLKPVVEQVDRRAELLLGEPPGR